MGRYQAGGASKLASLLEKRYEELRKQEVSPRLRLVYLEKTRK